MSIRVRIAPSPTGHLHIGTARTALYNFLFAKKNKGKFILRIEDTDLERSDEQYTRGIIEGLRWLGLDWDEGPEVGGKYGPYRQTERLETYAEYLEKLLKEGKAYYAFETVEELEKIREMQIAAGETARYMGAHRGLTPAEITAFRKEGRPGVIRLKMPDKKVKWNDLIRGEVEFDAALLGDIAIAKDLTTPLYNFAVVVDDFTMKISHVIRGEDHIPNTPKQMMIAEALGFPIPEFAHLPLILGADRSKMSKRHGATSVEAYREAGYLPEAIINFLALLGWNPGDQDGKSREVLSMKELIKEFSLDRVHKGGAIFNKEKLDWLNAHYIKEKPLKELTELCIPFLIEANLIAGKEKKYEIVHTKQPASFDFLKSVVALERERMKTLREIGESANFFFFDELKYDPEILVWKKSDAKGAKENLKKALGAFETMKEKDFTKEKIEKILFSLCGEDKGVLLWPVRVALSGRKNSPSPFDIAGILGKEKTLTRIQAALKLL